MLDLETAAMQILIVVLMTAACSGFALTILAALRFALNRAGRDRTVEKG